MCFVSLFHPDDENDADNDNADDDDNDDDDDDDGADNDDNVDLYYAVTPCNCSMLCAFGRVVSFEACCQWALSLLSVQITKTIPSI